MLEGIFAGPKLCSLARDFAFDVFVLFRSVRKQRYGYCSSSFRSSCRISIHCSDPA